MWCFSEGMKAFKAISMNFVAEQSVFYNTQIFSCNKKLTFLIFLTAYHDRGI